MADQTITFPSTDKYASNQLLSMIFKYAHPELKDEKLTAAEALDYFTKSDVIDTHEPEKNELTAKDNLALLRRMSKVVIKVDNPGFLTKKDIQRIHQRLETGRSMASGFLKEVCKKTPFPQIEEGLVGKTEIKSMLTHVALKTQQESLKAQMIHLQDPTNENKKQAYELKKKGHELIKHYITLFDKTPEKKLWIPNGGYNFLCSAACEETNDGKIIAYPRLNREAFTSIYNSFNNEDVQDVFASLTIKEAIHLERRPSRFREYQNAKINFLTHFTNAQDNGDIIFTDKLIESARWVISGRLHEEFIGFQGKCNWIKGQGFDEKKCAELEKRFAHIRSLEDIFYSFGMYFSRFSNEKGDLDEKKFERHFASLMYNEKRFNDKQYHSGSTYRLAARVLLLHHHVLKETRKLSKDETSYLSFLNNPTFQDMSKYPGKLNVRNTPPKPIER